jgi:hypothetical protein
MTDSHSRCEAIRQVLLKVPLQIAFDKSYFRAVLTDFAPFVPLHIAPLNSWLMIGAQRNENTSLQFECVFKTRSYLQLARVDKIEAALSSLLLVLCAASAVSWAVWQEAG